MLCYRGDVNEIAVLLTNMITILGIVESLLKAIRLQNNILWTSIHFWLYYTEQSKLNTSKNTDINTNTFKKFFRTPFQLRTIQIFETNFAIIIKKTFRCRCLGVHQTRIVDQYCGIILWINFVINNDTKNGALAGRRVNKSYARSMLCIIGCTTNSNIIFPSNVENNSN